MVQSYLCHVLLVGSQGNYLTLLNVSFLIYKMGIIRRIFLRSEIQCYSYASFAFKKNV